MFENLFNWLHKNVVDELETRFSALEARVAVLEPKAADAVAEAEAVAEVVTHPVEAVVEAAVAPAADQGSASGPLAPTPTEGSAS